MKTLIAFLLPLFIFATTITSSFNTSSGKLNTHLVNLSGASYDSSKNDNPTEVPKKGLDGMFNERGFVASNSYSYDENEIINDFNGNLQYSIPLHHIKGAGDLNVDVSLNYNGSMSYISYTGIRSDVLSGTIPPQQNITAPGWIISVNGMAIQTLNFETHLITQKVSGDEISDGNIKLLTNGYHVTRINQVLSGEKDKISLLQGDGSILTLENLENNKYEGYYYSTNKKDYTRAKVFKINDIVLQTNQEYYQKRRAFIARGDGLTYVYEEEYDNYYDYRFENDIRIMKPRSFYLKSIHDRFGNFINLYYGYYSYPHYGKQIIEEINASWDPTGASNIAFQYSSINDNGIIKVRNSVKGTYAINSSGFSFDPNVTYYHQARVNSVKNPLEQQCSINYGGTAYERTYENLLYNNTNYVPKVDLNFTSSNKLLRRITKFTNYNGGIRDYYYKGSNDMSIDLIPQEGIFYAIGSPSKFAGQGRDAFYTNMIDSVVFKASSTSSQYKRISYDYGYEDNGNSYYTDPVDESDVFSTSKKIEKQYGAPSDNYTPQSYMYEYYYKNYPTYDNDVNPSVSDFPGENVMYQMKEYSYGTSSFDLTKTTDYFTQKGPTTSSSYGDLYRGSFLDTMIQVTYPSSGSFTNVTRYEFLANFPFASNTDDQYRNPIKKTIQIDPFNQKTITEFFAMYDTSYTFPGGQYVPGYTLEQYQPVYFYLINQPLRTIKYVAESDTLYKDTIAYVSSILDSSKGYLGQSYRKRVFDKNNLISYQEFISNYCRGDTNGKYLYGSIHNLPGKEGNLQYTIDANGNYTRYYYNPINANEFISGIGTPEDYEGVIGEEFDGPNDPPKVSYYKVFDNNTAVLNNSYWQDRRLPTRVDNYYSGTKYNSSYTAYNLSGLPVKTFDNNKYLTSFEFDHTDRIRTGTLPYDFNNTTSYDSVAYDTVFFYSDTLITPTEIGMYNVLNNATYSSTNCGGNYYNDCELEALFNNDNYVDHFRPLIKYNSNFLNEFDTIYYAAYQFYPLYFNASLSGITLNINPITSLSSPITIGSSVAIENLLSTNTSTYCQANQFLNYINNYPNFVDVKPMLNAFLGSPQNFKGMTFTYSLPPGVPSPPPNHSVALFISNCIGIYSNDCGNWATYYSPRIKIQGVKRKITQRIIKVYQKATLRYVYDDAGNKINTYSKIDGAGYSAREIRNENLFDGFYRVTEKRKYYSPTGYNASQTQYNYLDKVYSTTDFNSNQTKLRYNKYMTASKTENPDSSYTLVDETFQNGLTYAFGTVSGPVCKQVFTDETGRNKEKYTDAVGNLRREVSFVATGAPNEEAPPPTSLVTDYNYDSLYRVISVRTPAYKYINYAYDGYGRMSIKQTPDAGTTKYKYDKNNNLTISQDANQAAQGANVYTVRLYDGLNRVTGIRSLRTRDSFDPGDFDELTGEEDFAVDFGGENPLPNDYMTVNVYDTVTNAISTDLFTSVPYDYYSTINNTRGRVVSTAYRTLYTDGWSYKWYRYDARGRVIKMWNAIDGFDTKVIEYTYNSGDVPVVTTYQMGAGDFSKFRNGYDILGRLAHVDYWDPSITPDPENPDGDSPTTQWINLTEFEYNPNSQIENQMFNTNSGDMQFNYAYNTRNWITVFDQVQSGDDPGDPEDIFHYNLFYEPNGNINGQSLSGKYAHEFSSSGILGFEYSYDLSNRLLNVNNPLGDAFDLTNTYDNDGNLLSLQRKDDEGNVDDNFSYNYTSGTNRLIRVSGSGTQFVYDYNGNMIADSINNNDIIEYDYRNLITNITRIIPGDLFTPPQTFVTMYQYDDAGNRIRKAVYMSNVAEPEPIGQITDAPPGDWTLLRNEFYIRGVDGNTIAEYNSTELEQWNLYAGADNFGKISDGKIINYYLKDHLGSTRAVLDMDRNVVSAQDYDAWGYPMEDRQYEPALLEYKFTGKERDNESNYDYFGARYYDSRIGRWGSIDPLFEKHIDWTPYNYVLGNPMNLIDPDGMQEIAIEVRTFIPFEKSMGFKGDDRYFSVDSKASYRTMQLAVINMSTSDEIFAKVDGKASTSNLIGIEGKGSAEFNFEGEKTKMEGSIKVDVTLKGTAKVGVLDKLPYPLNKFTPKIDYSVNATFTKDEKGNITFNVAGSANKFPAYEVLIHEGTGTTLAKTNYPEKNNPSLLYDIFGDEPLKEPQTIDP